jgi:hypothetical protein
MYALKTYVENNFALSHLNFHATKDGKFLHWLYHHEDKENVIHKLWLSFHLSAKLDMVGMIIALLGCHRGKDHHHA